MSCAAPSTYSVGRLDKPYESREEWSRLPTITGWVGLRAFLRFDATECAAVSPAGFRSYVRPT
jgi:hypothetical protein